MNKIYAIILCLALSSVGAQAQWQHKNQINFQTGKSHIKNSGFSKFDNLDYWQLSYFRTINKNWQVWGQYTKWLSELEDGQVLSINAPFTFNKLYTDVPIDVFNLVTADLGLTRTLYQKNAHKLVLLAGLSYGHATTSYVISGMIPTESDPMVDYIIINYKKIQEHFIGGTFGAKYDYTLLANRVNIGLTVQHQFLNNHMPLTTYLGLHLGVNF